MSGQRYIPTRSSISNWGQLELSKYLESYNINMYSKFYEFRINSTENIDTASVGCVLTAPLRLLPRFCI